MSNQKKIIFKLPEKPEDQAFKVPENYFETFDERLKDRISSLESEPDTPSEISFVRRYSWVASIAALFILSLFFFKWFLPHNTQPVLSNEEISAYLQQEVYNLDETLLYDQLDENIQAENIQKPNDNELSGMKDEIIEYLLQEDVETDLIAENL